MVIEEIGDITDRSDPLKLKQLDIREPHDKEILIRVLACGVCHTEIDEIEGRTAPPSLPVVPGHEIVGRVEVVGSNETTHKVGDRVGVGWFYGTCGRCRFCISGSENLCPEFVATGRDNDGGYAHFVIVPGESAFAIPDRFSDGEAAPLLCAGAVGYRSLMAARIENGERIGFVGFGASAHLVLQMARYLYPDSWIGVITRTAEKQRMAKELGAS